MSVSTAKPGDVVKVDLRGLVFLAEVREVRKEKGRKGCRLLIEPPRGISHFSVESKDVIGLYRKLGRKTNGG